MRPLKSGEIKGTWGTVLLPIAEGEAIDLGRLRDQIDALIASGVEGLYTNGTAGEFYTQSDAEFEAIHDLLVDRCDAADMPFQVGASQMSPQMCLERIRRSVQWRPSAIQVILPDWFPVSDAEAVAFLQRAAEAAHPIGLVLYNPPHAKRVLQPEDFGRIRQSVPSLVGIKVADGDGQWYARMREASRDLSVFVPGHHLATGISNGAHGSYSNVACLNPRAARQWYRLILADMGAALELEQRIRRFMDEHIVPFIVQGRYANQAVDKLLAAIGGWAPVGTRLRWPYRWIPEEEAVRLRPVLARALPEFRC